MGLLSNWVNTIDITQRCIYLGGHPYIGKACEGTLTVNNDKIIFKGGFLSKFEININEIINSNLQTQEQISSNVTASRLLLYGDLAFGMRKKMVDIIRYLVIQYSEDGIENSIVFQSKNIDILASEIMRARKIYAENHSEEKQANKEVENTNVVQDIPDQIRKLAKLKEDGILTEEEFNKKKMELLDRM